jgi:hypothetical protein
MIVMPTLAEGEYSDNAVVCRTVPGFVSAVLAFVAIIIHSGSGVKGKDQTQTIANRKHGITAYQVCTSGNGNWWKIVMPVYPHKFRVNGKVARSRQDLRVGVTIVEDASKPAEPEALRWAVDVKSRIRVFVMQPVLSGKPNGIAESYPSQQTQNKLESPARLKRAVSKIAVQAHAHTES